MSVIFQDWIYKTQSSVIACLSHITASLSSSDASLSCLSGQWYKGGKKPQTPPHKFDIKSIRHFKAKSLICNIFGTILDWNEEDFEQVSCWN